MLTALRLQSTTLNSREDSGILLVSERSLLAAGEGFLCMKVDFYTSTILKAYLELCLARRFWS